MQLIVIQDRYLEGNLEIKPPTRGVSLGARQKSNLVESILLGLPVPKYISIQRQALREPHTMRS